MIGRDKTCRACLLNNNRFRTVWNCWFFNCSK